ncbi:MAG: glycosyltransferase family 39 protein [Actinomycetota bacterium]
MNTGPITDTGETRPADEDRDDRRGAIALGAVFVVALATRLHRLGEDSLWDNEILSHARATADLGDAYDLIREGTHPPGYSQVILRPWLAIGDSELMQRLPSVVFGFVAIAITAALATRLAGRWAGIAAAGLSAVMPLHLYYSREGRMYALLALVLIAWIAALIRAHERDTWSWWAAYTALGAAALYTHYYAGFTVLSVVAVTAAFEYRSGLSDRTKRWALATGGIGIAFLPWLPTFRYQLSNDPVSHLQALSARELAELPIQFFTAFANRSNLDNLVIGAALMVLFVIALRALWSGRTTDADQGLAASVVVAAVVGTFALSVLVSLFRPLIFVRYFAGILPMTAIVLAVGVSRSRISDARTRWVALGAFGLLLLARLGHAVPTIDDTWRPDWRAATDQLETASADDSVTLLVGPDSGDFRVSGFWYYADPDLPVIEVTGQVTDPVFTDAVDQLDADIATVWVVQYELIDRVPELDDFEPVSFQRFDSRFFTGSYRISVVELDRTAS